MREEQGEATGEREREREQEQERERERQRERERKIGSWCALDKRQYEFVASVVSGKHLPRQGYG
jgi:hypothetical protein